MATKRPSEAALRPKNNQQVTNLHDLLYSFIQNYCVFYMPSCNISNSIVPTALQKVPYSTHTHTHAHRYGPWSTVVCSPLEEKRYSYCKQTSKPKKFNNYNIILHKWLYKF